MSRLPKRFSAGAVVVRPTTDGWRYLLLRVYRTWDFPKGGVEAGESALDAAVREVEEEAGLTDLKFPWGAAYCDTQPYSGGKVARYFLAMSPEQQVHLPVSLELGRPEHHEFRWLDHAGAKRVLPPRLQPILAWAQAVLSQKDAASEPATHA